MPTVELSIALLLISFSIIVLAYFSFRVRMVLSEERKASEIIQDMLGEITQRMKHQDMRILDQQVRLDILDVRRMNVKMPGFETNISRSNMVSDDAPLIASINNDISHDITSTELSILKLLITGSKTPIEVQRVIGLSREHVSRIMKEIYKKGLVSRETNERPYRYGLSHAGRELTGSSS